MYIQKIQIENIRAIEKLDLDFTNREAGWHVVIGDNGSGKTTIVQILADSFLNMNQLNAPMMDIHYKTIPNQIAKSGKFSFYLENNNFNFEISNEFVDTYFVKKTYNEHNEEIQETNPSRVDFRVNIKLYEKIVILKSLFKSKIFTINCLSKEDIKEDLLTPIQEKFFSSAYGAIRDVNGFFNNNNEKIDPKISSHITVFMPGFRLSSAFEWIKDIEYKILKNDIDSKILEYIKLLINKTDLLPNNLEYNGLNSEGFPEFVDKQGIKLTAYYLSSGFRSVVGLAFDLIYNLIKHYKEEVVFENFSENKLFIDLPGVVLIDEVDAHLHPTWQTRIGEWFTKTFPNIQFIVTTHSPLICRGCNYNGTIRGTIWKLAAPGSGEESKEITGMERKRLIYGNILDAYGTEAFGEVSESDEATVKKQRLAKLGMKNMTGRISPEEKKELLELRAIFQTGHEEISL